MAEESFDEPYRPSDDTPAPAAEVRRPGLRRTTRQRLALALGAFGVVVLLVAVAMVLTGRPAAAPLNPSPSPSVPVPPATTAAGTAGPSSTTGPPASPTAGTLVPAAVMLRPVDVGTGTWREVELMGDWSVGFTLSVCPAARVTGWVSPAPMGFREQKLVRTADNAAVLQSVRAYAAGDAERELAHLRAAVAACALIDHAGGVTTMTIRAERFAGDDSLLVETRSGDRRSLNVLVREGNLTSEIVVLPADEANARLVAQRAAARMCAASGTC